MRFFEISGGWVLKEKAVAGKRVRLFVAYDISDDKRRRKVFDFLSGFLRPTQRSFFSGYVRDSDVSFVVSGVEDLVNTEEDVVAFILFDGVHFDEIYIGGNDEEWNDVEIIF